MNKKMKITITTIMIILLWCASCVTTTTIETQEQVLRQAAKANMGSVSALTVKIKNNAENTHLEIDTCQVCNIIMYENLFDIGDILLNSETIVLEYSDSVETVPLTIPAQKFIQWYPNQNPLDEASYLKINTHISTVTPNYTIYKGYVYVPIVGHIKENQNNKLNVTLEKQCPWYCKVSDKFYKILQEITFEAHVDDWVTAEVDK
jgi:hypothetical protein